MSGKVQAVSNNFTIRSETVVIREPRDVQLPDPLEVHRDVPGLHLSGLQ